MPPPVNHATIRLPGNSGVGGGLGGLLAGVTGVGSGMAMGLGVGACGVAQFGRGVVGDAGGGGGGHAQGGGAVGLGAVGLGASSQVPSFHPPPHGTHTDAAVSVCGIYGVFRIPVLFVRQ
jgi:hypothetical protein